jgi:hypothetical protein
MFDGHPGNGVLGDHLQSGGVLGPRIQLRARHLRSIRDHSGQIHRVHRASGIKMAGKLLPPFDRFCDNLQVRDAHAENALRRHAMPRVNLTGLLATLAFQAGHDGCNARHRILL